MSSSPRPQLHGCCAITAIRFTPCLLAVCLAAAAESDVETPRLDAAPTRVVAYVAGWSMPRSVPAERLNQSYASYGGDLSYAELADCCIDRGGFVRRWDARARAPYLWNASTRIFISYDDPVSIAAKAAYVRQKRLGGMMFWELSQDRNGELLGAITNSP